MFGGVNDIPAVWTSDEAIKWTSLALPGANVSPSRAAASEKATVLLGVGTTSQCAHPSRAFLWRRAAGDRVWEAAPFVEQLFCAGGSGDVVANASTFVVAGAGTGDIPFAWRSGDGLIWEDANPGLPIDTFPSALTATSAGFLELARGERTDVEASADGSAWMQVQGPPVPPAFNGNAQGMSPAALFSVPAGTVAMFESDDASVLSSWRRDADGSWTELQVSGFEPGDAIGTGATIDGHAYLFVARQGRAVLLTSGDLAAWTPIQIPDLSSISGLATYAGRSVLVGTITDAAGDDHSLVFVTNGL